jgi:POT family proton-dependent oligopeptide transporter
MAAVDPGRDFAAGMVETTQNEAEYDKHEKDNHSVVQAESLHDGIHDGLTFPTDDEVHTLRRVPDSIPWNTYRGCLPGFDRAPTHLRTVIAVVEMAERFSYYGCVIVFQNFIQHPLPAGSKTGASHDPNTSAGALGRKQQTATGLTTFNSFWVYVIPLFGAYLADTRWGRFKTICIAVGIAIFGHILLVIASIPPLLAHPNGALGLFVVAIIIMGLGTGGFKANISPLVAEQYKRTKMFVATTKSGERVIVDPALTTTRIYMCMSASGALSSVHSLCAQTSTCSSTSARSSARSAWSMLRRTSATGSRICSRPSSSA